MSESGALLIVSGLSKSFRGLKAVQDVSFDVFPGERVAVIGPNGAGKTTCFNMIAGAIRPDRGQVRFDDVRIDGLTPERVCALGIGRTFQIVRPFPSLTVEENVIAASLPRSANMKEARQASSAVLAATRLDHRRLVRAGELTLPDRKRLELARALATKPRLLLLDEVAAGLRPAEADEFVEIVRRINMDHWVAVLMIEHVMRAVMSLAQRVVVLHHGELICVGTPSEVVRNPAVQQSYLGARSR